MSLVDSTLILTLLVTMNAGIIFPAVSGLPTVRLFSASNNVVGADGAADESFHQFISSKPDSVVIGELKPNASELEMMLLREKIASAISNMQGMEKSSSGSNLDHKNAECFIDVKRVERAPGKCHKLGNGLPICQSENYMALSDQCS